jgi:hypothetical protein
MMEVVVVLRQLAELGVTLPAGVAIVFLWKINRNFVDHDKRISILEAFHNLQK